MKILALDTSVGVSIAILDGPVVLSEFTDTQHGIQGEQTAAKISDLLIESGLSISDLTHVVVGVGPGPYTGLRVGIATAQAIAFARNIPVVGICSLDAVANDFGKPCLVVTDARRKELYWAHYEEKSSSEPNVDLPEKLVEKFPNATFVGPAAKLYPNHIDGNEIPLRAAALGVLFASGSATELPISPLYLRKPDAKEPSSRKSVL